MNNYFDEISDQEIFAKFAKHGDHFTSTNDTPDTGGSSFLDLTLERKTPVKAKRTGGQLKAQNSMGHTPTLRKTKRNLGKHLGDWDE